ncbi:MAG: NADP-dependent oxidoreductase [Xanthobacteraceae bacterium]
MNRQWWFVAPPEGKLTTRQFELRHSPAPSPQDGEVLVRHRYISLMPGNRAWMQRETYRSQLDPGQVMPGRALGEVLESRHAGFKKGDIVETNLGWQDYAAAPPSQLYKRDESRPIEHLLGVLGSSGITAYFGLLHVGRPRAGETLLVSAAAGGVGSFVSQLGKIAGCRVVGIAGGSTKCDWLTREVGIDHAVDYKADDFAKRLSAACPDGVDLFFDNTGGPVLEAALDAMKIGGRIVCCGNTAQYDSDVPESGPKGLPLKLIVKSLTMTGFVMHSYRQCWSEAEADIWRWFQEGRIKPFYHIVHGLENTPAALIGLLNGENRGITLVRI